MSAMFRNLNPNFHSHFTRGDITFHLVRLFLKLSCTTHSRRPLTSHIEKHLPKTGGKKHMQIYTHTLRNEENGRKGNEQATPPIVISACYIKISAYLARTNISVTNDLRVGGGGQAFDYPLSTLTWVSGRMIAPLRHI